MSALSLELVSYEELEEGKVYLMVKDLLFQEMEVIRIRKVLVKKEILEVEDLRGSIFQLTLAENPIFLRV